MLAQHDLKRLLAYSGIAQVGYILTALAGHRARPALRDLLSRRVYVYEPRCVRGRRRHSDDGEQGSRLTSYEGLARRRPWLAAAMTFFLARAGGVAADRRLSRKDSDPVVERRTPATSGWRRLLIAGTAISLYAYAKIVFAMYSRPRHEPHDPARSSRLLGRAPRCVRSP